MRPTLTLVFILLLSLSGHSQTFNQRYDLGYAAVVFTGLEIKDSIVHVTGILAEDDPPYYPAGVLNLHFDLEGNLDTVMTYFLSDNREIGNWFGGLLPYKDGFLSMASIFGGGEPPEAGIVYHDSTGQVDHVQNIPRHFPEHPEFLKNFMLPVNPCIGEDNSIMVPAVELDPWNGTNNYQTLLRYFDEDGNEIWRKEFGLNNFLDIPSGIVRHQEQFIVFGVRTNYPIIRKGFTFRIWIFAVDIGGSVIWEYFSPSDSLIDKPILYVEEDGSMIVATNLVEEEVVNSESSYPIRGPAYFYKLNTDQEVEWSTLFRDPYPTLAGSPIRKIVKASDDSGYLAVGYSSRLDEEHGPDLVGWLVKLSSEGDSLWSRTYRFLEPNGHFDESTLYDVEETPDGGFILCGEIIYQLQTPILQQGWLLKVDEHGCLVPGCHLLDATEDLYPAKETLYLQLYPNPATTHVYAILDTPTPTQADQQLRLLDMQGRVVQSWPVQPQADLTHVLPVGHLQNGVYVLQHWAGGRVVASEQLVKQ